ncbi:glycosyltransferase [Siccibacter turicensis]|uniref:glycosyltransferase n=1 Tax=Siccibacter turicensis TaxID=357233 RepID=UPI0023F3CDB0|nr:glycosyltransferase [Siccibacter turicensis]
MSEHTLAAAHFADTRLLVDEALRRFEGGAQTVILDGLDEDRYHEAAFPLAQAGYRCVNGTPAHRFVRLAHDKQHIVATATNDNFHFLQPVMRLMREQGHLVSEVSSVDLNAQTLIGVLKHCDVAWFEWGDGMVVPASKLPKYCRMVCRIHGYELFQPHFLQANWQNIDEVVVVSEAMKARFIALLGDKLPAMLRITVLGNLTDHQPLARVTPHRNRFHLACVARFSPPKNLHLLLPLMQALVKRDKRYKIFIAGRVEDERMYYSFCQLVESYGLQKHVVYCGTLPGHEMAKWYQDKSCLVSVSYHETQGMGIFEAMLAGLKPVAFNAAGGLHEYLPEQYRVSDIDEAVASITADNAAPEHYAREGEVLLRQAQLRSLYPRLWQREEKDARLFSILIPTWNRERYVLPAVCSALTQRDPHFEVVVVDDGSTDSSLTLLDGLNDPRLRVIRKAHTNAPDTRNRAIAEAKGDYVVWLDSDDLLHANALSHYRTLLTRFSQVDVISCGLEKHGADKQFYSLVNHPPARRLHQVIHGNFISNPGSCVRRSLYARVGGYNPAFVRAHDYEFWSRAVGEAQVMFSACCNVSYRLHDGNLTGVGKQVDLSWEYRIFTALVERYTPQALLPAHSPKAREAFIAARREQLYSQCEVDNLFIVIDAINPPLQHLTSQLALLARQKDRQFHLLIVADKPLPFLGQPVLIAERISPQAIAAYIAQKLPGQFCRSYLLQNAAFTGDATQAVSQLKKSMLGEADVPSLFRRLTA